MHNSLNNTLCNTLHSTIGTAHSGNTDSNAESDSSSNSNSPVEVSDLLSESRRGQLCDLKILSRPPRFERIKPRRHKALYN